MRVVSLVPSITETLLAWGVTPVGVTRFCEQPGLTAVGGTKNPDVSAIVELAPDLVVMDTEENRRDDHDALAARGLVVLSTSVRSVADVDTALAGLAAMVRADAPPSVAEPTPELGDAVAFVPIWRRPTMTINGDTYGASVLAQLGIATLHAGDADRYPTVELDEVAQRRPTLAVVPTEPYSFTREHCDELAAALGCPAVLVDGKDLFWWGVRTPAAVERLREQLAEWSV